MGMSWTVMDCHGSKDGLIQTYPEFTQVIDHIRGGVDLISFDHF